MAQAKTRSRSSTPKSRSRSSAAKSNDAGRADSARHAVEHTVKAAGHSVGRAASKAKLPLVASGAALVGAAGGLAVGARRGRRGKGIGKVIPRRPQGKARSRDLAHAAKEVGSFGAQMGRLSLRAAKRSRSERQASLADRGGPRGAYREALTRLAEPPAAAGWGSQG